MTLTKLLASDGFICVNKAVMKSFGVVTALVLGELCAEYNYWEAKDALEDGFFFSTLKNIEEETTIKRDVQNKTFKILEKYGVIEVKRKNMPARRYVRIDEDKLFDFLTLCAKNCETNTKNEGETSTKNCTSNENENTQFTIKSYSSLRENRKQDYVQNVNYIYNSNNTNNNNTNSNNTIKDKSFIVGKNSIKTDLNNDFTKTENTDKGNESFSENKDKSFNLNSFNETKLNSLSNDNTDVNLISLNKEDNLVKNTKCDAALNDLTKNDLTKESKSTAKTDKTVKPFKLKPKKETKRKKQLGDINKQFELIDVYFNNGETCNHPEIASLIKQQLQQRLKKAGYKNYSDLRWENQLKMLIDNAEGDWDYMAELIKLSISRDYVDITFPNQKKSLMQSRNNYNKPANNFDTAKDNTKVAGYALLTPEEKEDYNKNKLVTDADGNPMEF